MPIVRIRKTREFSTVANAPFNNENLSWEARGMLAFLLTKPDNWEVSVAHLVKSSPAGRDKVYRIMQELEESGNLIRIQERDSATGKIAGYRYEVHEQGSKVPALEVVPVTPREKKPAKIGTTMKEDWAPTDTDISWALSLGVVNTDALMMVTEEFKLHFMEKKVVRSNWSVSWKKWIHSALNEDHWGYRPALRHLNTATGL